jgi:hypothetical protein
MKKGTWVTEQVAQTAMSVEEAITALVTSLMAEPGIEANERLKRVQRVWKLKAQLLGQDGADTADTQGGVAPINDAAAREAEYRSRPATLQGLLRLEGAVAALEDAQAGRRGGVPLLSAGADRARVKEFWQDNGPLPRKGWQLLAKALGR